MKIQKLLLVGAAAAMLAGTTRANDTINITGSTAFRAAIVKAIVDSYTSVTAAYTGSSINGGNQQLFKGAYPGISGTTYIRTAWNGSVEGVQALAGSVVTSYIPISAATSAVTTGGSAGAYTLGGGTFYNNAGAPSTYPLETGTPHFAYSDVFQASTPVSSPTYGDDQVGVVLFKWLATKGAGSALSNVTLQQANALWTNGYLSLSQFTGNSADSGTTVYATGRYNGSGTRATGLAEIGFGVFNQVKQYYLTTSGAAGTISALTKWPVLGGTATTGGTNDPVLGNGGYTSGSGVRDAIDGTFAGTVAVDIGGGPANVSGSTIAAVCWLGVADSVTALSNGAIELKYNGVTYSQAAVQNGQYTFWGYEHAIYPTLSTNQSSVKTNIASNIPNAFTFYGVAASPGLDASTMTVYRSAGDGSVVGP